MRIERWNIEKALRYVVGFIHQLLFRFQANYSSFRLWCKMILIVGDMVERTWIVSFSYHSSSFPLLQQLKYRSFRFRSISSKDSISIGIRIKYHKSVFPALPFHSLSPGMMDQGERRKDRWDQKRTRGERNWRGKRRARESIERELFFHILFVVKRIPWSNMPLLHS